MADPVKDEVVAPQPGTPEYDAAMAAKADENATKAQVAADGEAPKEAQQEPQQEAPEEGEKKPEGEQAKEAVEAAGIDYNKLQEEYAEKGELSEESFKALEKAGFPKEVVDEFIAGRIARAELRVMKAESAVGGKEALAQMQAWAATALSPAEIETYNKAVNGSEEEMIQAVTSLKGRYEGTYGRQPSLLGGAPAGEVKLGYASKAEMTADMRNPQYAKDPAFRAKVTAKIAATTAF